MQVDRILTTEFLVGYFKLQFMCQLIHQVELNLAWIADGCSQLRLLKSKDDLLLCVPEVGCIRAELLPVEEQV